MKGIKNFITGFSLSLISVSLAGQLYSPLPQQKKYVARDITIDLFKTHDAALPFISNAPLIKEVAKHSIINTAHAEPLSAFPETPENIADINGAEDDEILNVNIDDIIPIDFANADVPQQVEILETEEENLSAMLPNNISHADARLDISDPWEIAKGGKHIKNKKLLESTKEQTPPELSTHNLRADINNDAEISYKVAEKIKQSIIFPIPDEILNDEDLTPTFIKGHRNTTSAPKKAPIAQRPTPKQNADKRTESVKVIKKTPTIETIKEEENSKGLLNSISSWFATTSDEGKKQKQNKVAPSYNSQSAHSTQTNEAALPANNEFANFYETLQETAKAHQQNKILPSELKLSFQPDRAEISGQTLRWLKAFSEAASAENSYLQIRLDATTPTDIQRKRLNLLYSIFINNGVTPQKIDTVFSLTEPNAFIIRSLSYD